MRKRNNTTRGMHKARCCLASHNHRGRTERDDAVAGAQGTAHAGVGANSDGSGRAGGDRADEERVGAECGRRADAPVDLRALGAVAQDDRAGSGGVQRRRAGEEVLAAAVEGQNAGQAEGSGGSVVAARQEHLCAELSRLFFIPYSSYSSSSFF